MKKNRWISLALVLALLISLCPNVFAAEPKRADIGERPTRSLSAPPVLSTRLAEQYKPGDQVRVIVLTQKPRLWSSASSARTRS